MPLYIYYPIFSISAHLCITCRVNVHLVGLQSDCLQRAATVYILHKTNIRLQGPLLELAACSRIAFVKIACWNSPSRSKLTSLNFTFLLEVLKLAAWCMVTLCFLYSQQSSIVTC